MVRGILRKKCVCFDKKIRTLAEVICICKEC
jgi:hypothetical protein